jgi:hypothetical protein
MTSPVVEAGTGGNGALAARSLWVKWLLTLLAFSLAVWTLFALGPRNDRAFVQHQPGGMGLLQMTADRRAERQEASIKRWAVRRRRISAVTARGLDVAIGS